MIENNLVVFNDFEVDFLTKEDVNFEFEGDVLFSGRQVAVLLGYTNPSKTLNDHIDSECKIIIKNSDITNSYFRNLNNAGETFITEDGVLDLTYRSNMPKAKEFRKTVRNIVKKVGSTGRFDSTEQNLMLIEDKTERTLALGLYSLELALQSNPRDVTISIMCDNKRLALEQYRHSKEMQAMMVKQKELENRTSQIESKADQVEEKLDSIVIVGSRAEFKREVDMICRTIGTKQPDVYTNTYRRFRDAYGIDIVVRAENKRKEIQRQRELDGKKKYAESTLKQKINPLDIIDEMGMWKDLSKCLSQVKSELLDSME